ncbi:MAG: hypothetical protein IKI36_06470 [Prevotella sp.]|nr:hypothetical protein [Prevotella sp.]
MNKQAKIKLSLFLINDINDVVLFRKYAFLQFANLVIFHANNKENAKKVKNE